MNSCVDDNKSIEMIMITNTVPYSPIQAPTLPTIKSTTDIVINKQRLKRETRNKHWQNKNNRTRKRKKETKQQVINDDDHQQARRWWIAKRMEQFRKTGEVLPIDTEDESDDQNARKKQKTMTRFDCMEIKDVMQIWESELDETLPKSIISYDKYKEYFDFINEEQRNFDSKLNTDIVNIMDNTQSLNVTSKYDTTTTNIDNDDKIGDNVNSNTYEQDKSNIHEGYNLSSNFEPYIFSNKSRKTIIYGIDAPYYLNDSKRSTKTINNHLVMVDKETDNNTQNQCDSDTVEPKKIRQHQVSKYINLHDLVKEGKAHLWPCIRKGTRQFKILAIKDTHEIKYNQLVLKYKTKSSELRSHPPGTLLNHYVAVAQRARNGYIEIIGQTRVCDYQIVSRQDLESSYWQQYHCITNEKGKKKFIRDRVKPPVLWHLQQSEQYKNIIYCPYKKCDGQNGLYTCFDYRDLTLNLPSVNL